MDTYRNLIGERVRGISELYPGKEALVHLGTGARYSYSLFSWEVERAARGLVRAGVEKGDRVAICASNLPEWLIAMVAIARIGALMVPMDPGSPREDLSYMLGQSRTRLLLAEVDGDSEEGVTPLLELKDTLPHLEQIVVLGEDSFPETLSWSDLTSQGDQASPETLASVEGSLSPDAPVAIMYTSGTTGRPKGVVLTHEGLVCKSLDSTSRQGIEGQDRMCLFFPLFHMFGNTCIALAGLLRGATLVMPCQRFDPGPILHALDREACTAIYGSPSMLTGLLEHPEFKKKHWKTVKKGIVGGAQCPVDLMRRLAEEIGVSRVTVGYGITEASSWVTMTRPEDPLERRTSTVGTPLPCCEVRVLDPLNGREVPPGIQGELCTRGHLMQGYYAMPGATAAVMDQQGWFHTGDLAVQDEEGYVRITGRHKEVIVRDGIEIYPVELEEIFYRIPEVAMVQVFGFPWPGKGKEVAVWARGREGAGDLVPALKACALDHVPEEKRPRFYRTVTEFPMTRTGKIQKYRLAELAAAEYGGT